MKRVSLLLIGLLCLSVATLAGEVITNDTGEGATGLRVVFASPVLITGFGDVLRSVDPQMRAFKFVFSGGTVESWGGHWLGWTPNTPAIVSHEWITYDPLPHFDGRVAGEPVTLEEAVYEYNVSLSSDDASSTIAGTITCYVWQMWPFSIRLSADFEDASSYEWELACETLHESDVEFSLLCVDSNYEWLSVSLSLEDDADHTYHWEHEFPLDIFNKTNVVLDATRLVPADQIASVSWAAWNMVDEDPGSFPIVNSEEPITSISTYWPNVINVRATITTIERETLDYEGEILFFERDENPVPLRGVVATQSANYNTTPIADLEDMWDDAFKFLERFGATALQHHHPWYYGPPTSDELGRRVFTFEPLYNLPDGSHDPRGITPLPERVGMYFDAGRDRGFAMILEARAWAYHTTPEVNRIWAISGYGTDEAYLTEWGWIYSPQGLWNMFTEVGQMAIEHQASGLVLECEEYGWIVNGGEIYQQFYSNLLKDLRSSGYAGSLTFAPVFVRRFGLVDDPAYTALLDPMTSGIPFAHEDMSLSITLYPSLNAEDSAPMDEIYLNAYDYLTQAVLPFSAAYGGKRIYIEDMQCTAVEGAVADPVEALDQPRSELGQVKWFWVMWRAIFELNRTHDGIFSGVTSAYHSLAPEWWRSAITVHTVPGSEKTPYLDFPFNEYIAKALTIFYADRGNQDMMISHY